MIQFRDLKTQYQNYKSEIDCAIGNVLEQGQYIGGEIVTSLEMRLANYVGVKHCISCSNGTEAMTLLLMAWGIGEGDAVFVPNFTFFSTGEVVSYVGATPIFVDVDPLTFNMDPAKLEAAIVRTIKDTQLKPQLVIPVDLFGLSADYPSIELIAEKYNLKVLGDSAQGFGSEINGKKSSSFGDASTTSFFPAKPLGCYGDGGAIFTNDDDLATLLNSLKVHGKGSDKYDNVRIGVNSRLDTIQAAILHVKLDAFINHELNDVNNVYQWYTEHLKGIVQTPFIPEGFVSSFSQYTIKVDDVITRDALQQFLSEHSIPSMIYYTKPMHQQTAFSYLKQEDVDFSVSINLSDTVLSLPMHPYLTKKDVEGISSKIESFFKKKVK